jgi:uncharacterized protein with NRDE domain
MCLIVIAFHHHPDYPLIIAANRDEFYSRPTAPLGYWTDYPQILGGRDLQSLGTWLAMDTSGRLGAVTNYRDPRALQQSPEGPSRGLLINRFLTGQKPPEAYLRQVRAEKDAYNGFNLLVGDSRELWWYCNVADEMQQLSPGIHGISNHLLNTPWPKVEKLKTGLAALLANPSRPSSEAIFEKLSDTACPSDEELPDTGIDREWERILSPVFIRSPIYGTRSSSVLFIDNEGHAVFLERSFYIENPEGPLPSETRRFEFSIRS